MSNFLYIVVGTFQSLDATSSEVMVTAEDSYGRHFECFDSVDELMAMYPTKKALVYHILSLEPFDGGAVLDTPTDGEWELDCISHIEVCGYPGD